MDVNSLLGANGSGANSNAAEAKQEFSETYETFLKLLTTQLRHQDPLEPLDTHEFTQQLVQFSGVEQAIATNKRLEELLAFQTQNQSVAALGYIGQTVEAVSDGVALVDGEATMVYGLAHNANAGAITIKDANGVTINTIPIEKGAGKHTFVWDGRNSDGEVMADGVFTFSVAAVDKDNASIDTATGIIGKVTSVESGADGVLLSMNGVFIPMERVLSVKAAAPAPAES